VTGAFLFCTILTPLFLLVTMSVYTDKGKGMAFHKLGQTRQVIQWSQVTETLGDCVLVPISPAVFHVACKLLAERGLWPSTFAIDTPKNVGYHSPDVTSAEWLSYKAEVSDFIADGQEFMTKFNDLLTTNLMVVSALTGDTIDRDHPENHLTGEYNPTGLTETAVITNTRLNTINTTINDRLAVTNQHLSDQISKLEEIRQVLLTIAGNEPSDIADELVGIAETVGDVALILGAM
jgi:hypothetical protein